MRIGHTFRGNLHNHSFNFMANEINCIHRNFSTIGEDENGKDILKCDGCYQTITYQDLKTEFKTKSIAEIIDEAKDTKDMTRYRCSDSDGDDENDNADRLQDKIDEDRLSNDLNL